FGLPIGIVCGLAGMLLSVEWEVNGFAGLGLAVAIGAALALPAGWLYARLLRAVEGQEMIVGTYLAFSVVSLMNIGWLEAPLRSPEIIWPYGQTGARTTISLTGHYKKALDSAGQVLVSRHGVRRVEPGKERESLREIGGRGIIVPTGLLAVAFGAALAYALFARTRLGRAMQATGANPRFARQSGIAVESCRTLGVVLSTVMGAVGIVVYAQSIGFVQLYNAPLMMAFPAVAAILIGGASVQRATGVHALVGVFLFQALLTAALPVANEVVQRDFSAVWKVAFQNFSEPARVMVTNGMILYAITRKE
ncbi:MAG: ABC transporter, partial [Planctomycetes bacterium]|nr:ABC transporter [Planctomycetota bacterium]